MPAPEDRKLTKETVQRIASEQARLTLSNDDANALLDIVNDLLGEADEAAKLKREGIEPATFFTMEGWAND